MKRWLPLGAVFLGAAVIAVRMLIPAWMPGQYAGTWYDCRNGNAYVFQSGIVTGEGASFSGAYSPGRNSVLLFVSELPDLQKERELELIRKGREEHLCDPETGKAYFSREKRTGVK